MKWKNQQTGEMIPRWRASEDGNPWLLEYPALEKTGLVEHCFTTRLGGVSRGIFSTLNLSFTRGDEPEAVRENFERIAGVLHTAVDRFVLSDQTHTTNVRVVKEEDAGKGITRERDYRDVDGLVTNAVGLVLATFYADCVPLFFVDAKRRAIGLSHSGWRGTAKRMGQVTLRTMREEFGTDPKDVICAIGPSICQECYEVSTDVAAAFWEEFAEVSEDFLLDKGNGKYQLDLWKANTRVLLDAGVLPEHISCTNVCTCCNSEVLFSHRATGGRRGNLGAFICLKEDMGYVREKA